MAEIIRYVNVNSPAGGDGTTDATAGVNRAYSSMFEMEAAEKTDLVAAGDNFTCICAGGVDSTPVVFTGWVTGASNTITLTTTTDRHNGAFDAAKYNIDNGTNITIPLDVREEYVNIIGLQFNRDSSTPSGSLRASCIVRSVGTGVFKLEQNIFKSSAPDVTGEISGFRLGDSSVAYNIKNNLFYDFDGANDFGISTDAGSPTGDYYNNTFINCTNGIEANTAIPITNNIFQDCSTDIVASPDSASDYNLTDNLSIIGSNSVTSSTLTFENKAADNFALASVDTDAIGAGIGTSFDVNVPLVDIVGEDRVGATTDIGAFLFVLPPSTVVITDTTDPLNTNSTLTVNGSGFESNDTNSKIEQIQGANTVILSDGTWSDTQIVTNGADVESTALYYGTHNLRVTAHSEAAGDIAFESIPSVNNDYVQLTSVAVTGDRITSIPDLDGTEQLRYQAFLYQGASSTPYDVIVNDDATFSISGSTPDGNYTFDVRAYDFADESWGTVGAQSVTVSGGVPVETGGMISPMKNGMISSMITNIIREES